ncbi:MAG: ATP/GTP-binding protein [Nitrospiria bacterium]
MLTQLRLRNFKRFEDAQVELGKSVVLIGPNNSGKTTVLQALALWDIGLRQWNSKREGKTSPKSRPGVTINRRDLVSIPVPSANLLWRGLHVRGSSKVKGKPQTRNIRIDVIVEGIFKGKTWSCGLEFDYSNEESFLCRPARMEGYGNEPVAKAEFSEIPNEAAHVSVAYLPPMSGLIDREFIKQQGEINFLIGQGQTAQVLRNLCYQIYQQKKASWEKMSVCLQSLFGVVLLEPQFISERSEITMGYVENGIRLDLSGAGRGLQQTLLLLAHLYANPETVLLLDEPDAHLEVLRQRQIYGLLTDVAEQQNSQIIAASHSEVVLGEAAGRGKVVAFVGKPHTINDKGSQVLKSLSSIGWDQYYQAEETGWVLYLEGSTDLKILQSFAKTLEHPATNYLECPFVHYVATNLPQKAREHFYGLAEAKPDLKGIAIFDRLNAELHKDSQLMELMWERYEIENYFCMEDVLLAYVGHNLSKDLFGWAQSEKRRESMKESISEVTTLLEIDELDPWSPDVKATDQVLDRIFRLFFKKQNLLLTFRKSDYHILADLVSKDRIDTEIVGKLDAIVKVAKEGKPNRSI